MKQVAKIIGIILLIAMFSGCIVSKSQMSQNEIAARHLEKAKKLEAEGNMIAARDEYEKVLTIKPNNSEAKERIAKITPNLLKEADHHFQAGLNYFSKGLYAKARKEFLATLKYNPDHLKAKSILDVMGREIEAGIWYIPHVIQRGESLSRLAQRYYGDRRKFDLIADYNKMQNASKVTIGQKIKIPVPEHVILKVDLEKIFPDMQEGAASASNRPISIKRYIYHTVRFGESLSLLAKMYYGEYSQFHFIAEFNDLSESSMLQVGQKIKIPEGDPIPKILNKVGSEDKNKIEPKQTDSEDKGSPPPTDIAAKYRDMGIELFNNKEYMAAITEFQKVLNVNPEDDLTLNYLSRAHLEKGKLSLAKGEYDQAGKEFEASLRYNESCDECSGKYLESLLNHAIALYNEEKFREAIAEIEVIIQKYPDNSVAYEYLAKSHFKQGEVLFEKEDYLAARDEFQAALQYNQDCVQCREKIRTCEETYKAVHYVRGFTYHLNENLPEAIREWSLVYQLDPDYKKVGQRLTAAEAQLKAIKNIKNETME